ncbi:MAG: hypothetical protein M1825_005637 [Sarcosagium campestre]|nr:MAG: hypothetical protein M1825_005637 [Sarcosagium campestre]
MALPSKSVIDLLKGWPSTTLLPCKQVEDAARVAFSDRTVVVPGLLYGPDAGYQPLREELSIWLSSFYEATVAEHLCITGGASQNLACVLQVFSDPKFTRNIWMVAPTYFLASRIFSDNGFHGRMRAVPEDKNGLDVEYFGRALAEVDGASVNEPTKEPAPYRPWGKVYRHIFYAVPTFSNPSGKTMSLDRRRQMVRLARKHDALIVTDDVYDLLQWPSDRASQEGGQPDLSRAVLPRLVDIDRHLDGGAERPGSDGFGNAMSNGSFSKIAGPGCRTGWAEGTPKFVYGLSQVGSSRSGGAASQLTATLMSQLLKTGELQRHIANVLRPAYEKRYNAMMAAIEEYLVPVGVTVQRESLQGVNVAGGYFIWISLPAHRKAEEIAAAAKEEQNLIVAHGNLFDVPSLHGDKTNANYGNSIRLCFAWEDGEKIPAGIQRLASVIRKSP